MMLLFKRKVALIYKKKSVVQTGRLKVHLGEGR